MSIRAALVLVALAVVGVSGAPAPAGVAAGPKCSRGQVSVTFGTNHRCVAAKGFLPKPVPSEALGTSLARHVLDGELEQAVFERFPLPSQLKTKPAPIGAPLAASAAVKVEPTAQKILAAAKASGKSVRRIQSVRAVQDFSQSATVAIPGQNGVTGTMTVDGSMPTGNDGELDPSSASWGLSFNLEKDGVKVSQGIRLGMNDGFKMDSPCPAASGDLHGVSKLGMQLHTNVSPGAGVDYLFKMITLNGAGSSSTRVNPNATLGTISFSERLSVTAAEEVSLLHGLFVRGYRVTIAVQWQGTVDGTTGNVTVTSLTARMIGDGAKGIGSGGLGAAVAAANADPHLTDQWKQLAVDEGDSIWNRYRSAEEKFQEPNHCAQITFDPETDDHLTDGATATVSGRIGPKEGGGSSDSVWEPATVKRGQVRGLPGTTSAAQPVKITVTGGAPDADRITADFDEQARSRAGIAEKEWFGRDSGWLVTIKGPVSAEQGCCWNVSATAGASVRVTQQMVGGVTGFHGAGTWSYAGLTFASNGVEIGCSYALNGAAGTPSVTITPSADGKTLSLRIVLTDQVSGSITCPMAGTHPLGGPLVSSYYLQSGGQSPVVTLPEDGSGSASITWSTPGPVTQSTGQLTVTVSHL